MPIELGGYLWKADPWGRTFKRRFFQLKPVAGALIYAVDDSPAELANPRGEIDLLNSRLCRGADWLVAARAAVGLSILCFLHPA